MTKQNVGLTTGNTNVFGAMNANGALDPTQESEENALVGKVFSNMEN